jgi:hypothetical protein
VQRLESRTLPVALLVSLLLWNLPYGGVVLYPFKLLATWLHELSHGLVMTITGAGLDRVVIYRDSSGLAYQQWSITAPGTALIAAAGYMGTALWGALLLVATPSPVAARRALLVLAALMIGTALTVVAPSANGDDFGRWSTLAIGGTVAACGIFLPARWRLLVAHFLAAQACINALLDIRVLLRPTQVINGLETPKSDATKMAMSTFGVEETWAVWTWAVIWLLWSLAVLFVALRIARIREQRALTRSTPESS